MRALLAACVLGSIACTADVTNTNHNNGTDGGTQPDPRRVRFVAMGDAGKGNAGQRQVAIALRDVCAAKGCDFVLMLGDNIYESGTESVTDPQWQTKFEQPYADVDLPFYAALGNHDNGGKLIVSIPGFGNEFERGKVEVDYTAVSTKWTMPATHYTFTMGHVGFVVLDTNAIMWSSTIYGDQAAWIPTAIMETSNAEWRFVAGHHPYRSNGSHGNAGDYGAVGGIPIQKGTEIKQFFDEHICGIGQVYFSGHDHNRQWIDMPGELCGMQMIVSGAGAVTTPLQDRGNQVRFAEDTEPGFLYVDVDGDRFTGTFYDARGIADFTYSFTKP